MAASAELAEGADRAALVRARLLEACEAGDVTAARLALEDGADARSSDRVRVKLACAHWAVVRGNRGAWGCKNGIVNQTFDASRAGRSISHARGIDARALGRVRFAAGAGLLGDGGMRKREIRE